VNVGIHQTGNEKFSGEVDFLAVKCRRPCPADLGDVRVLDQNVAEVLLLNCRVDDVRARKQQ